MIKRGYYKCINVEKVSKKNVINVEKIEKVEKAKKTCKNLKIPTKKIPTMKEKVINKQGRFN